MAQSVAGCLQCGLSLDSQQKEFCCDACSLLYKVLNEQKEFQIANPQIQPFSFLDQDEFKDLYCLDVEQKTMRFFAKGMHCTSCVHLVEKLPEFDEGITESIANFPNSTVTVKINGLGRFSRVAALLKEIGYEPIPIEKSADSTNYLQQENRKLLIKIAVAGACAANIMLFVIPVYAGLTGTYLTVFLWLTMILFLPILFYSATPFYLGAWSALKSRSLSIDLPIVVAMLSGFSLSLYNLLIGSSEVYFDSLASFLFLILGTRFLLKRYQQKHLFIGSLGNLFAVEKVWALIENQWILRPSSQIKLGDIIKIKSGDKLPCDGTIATHEAYLDLSLFSGESLPRKLGAGQTVYAGSKVVGDEAILNVTAIGSQTRLGSMLSNIELMSVKKSRLVNFTDRASQVLLLVVFGIAGVFFIFHAQTSVVEAFNRSLALLIVACPCAMAFGTPLAFGVGVRRASEAGIYIKNANILEKLTQVKNLVLDKTGTITLGQLKLISSVPAKIPQETVDLLLALEWNSDHPIAHALRNEWGAKQPSLSLQNICEISGQGVKAVYNEREVAFVGETQAHAAEIVSSLFIDGKKILELHFADEIRPDTLMTVHQLKKMGYEIWLSSGDHALSVKKVAQQSGIDANKALASQSPEDKLQLVSRLNPAIMLGDGANDSLALGQSSVGIAVKGGMDLSLKASDVYFSKQGISSLLKLIKISHSTVKTVKRNLWIALVYNLIAGVASLMGYVDPLIAAVLMPISSAFIVVSSIQGENT